MYRDEIEAARLRIAALEAELDALRREGESKRSSTTTSLWPQSAQARVGSRPALAIVALFAIGLGTTVVWASASSPRARLRPARTPTPVQGPPASEPLASMAAGDLALSSDPTPEPEADPISVALEPAHPEVIDVLASVDRSSDVFVLHRWLGALAWEHTQRDAGTLESAQADFERRRTVCEDGTDDDEETIRCSLEEAPDRWVGTAEALCEDAHALEIAHLVRDGDRLTVLGRVRIVEVACGDPRQPLEAQIRAGELDGDGALELTAIVPFSVPTAAVDTYESATLGVVLDARDLHAQLVVLRDYDGAYGDATSIARTAATSWSLEDRDHDGAIEAHLRQRIADADEVDRSTAARTEVCPYDRASDRWRCRAPWMTEVRDAAIFGSGLHDLELVH